VKESLDTCTGGTEEIEASDFGRPDLEHSSATVLAEMLETGGRQEPPSIKDSSHLSQVCQSESELESL